MSQATAHEPGTVAGHAESASDHTHPRAWMAKRALQVTGVALQEKLQPPRATTADDVPVSGEAVTPEWLTAVLCAGHPGAEVVAVETPGGSVGTSTRKSLRLTYNDAGRAAGLPTDLYTKATTSLTQRILLGMADVLDGEPRFYNDFRPYVDIEAPMGYFTAVDPRSWRSLTLIEDVAATKGATFTEPVTPLSREQIESLLVSVATWHGTFWDSPRLEAAGLKRPADFLRTISMFISFRKRSQVGAKRAEAVIPEALRPRQDDLWRGYERAMDLAGEGTLTLLHGDSHTGNTYLTAAGDMGFADWQVIQRGNWGYDFAYIVSSALEVEDRRAWERELLAFYLERLAAAGGEAPEFDDAWLKYRQLIFHAYFAWVFTIGRAAFQPKMQPDDFSTAIIERTSNAINDLGSLEAIGV